MNNATLFAIAVYGVSVVACVLSLLVLYRGWSIKILSAASDYVSALLSIRETLKNLIDVLSPKSDDAQVVFGQSPSFVMSTPCRIGWFWTNGIPKRGVLVNVKVPIGFVAQLPCNPIDSLDQYLESSQTCLLSEDGFLGSSNSDDQETRFCDIRMLKRVENWTFKINPQNAQKKITRTKETFPITAVCEVQTEFLPEGTSYEKMKVVFSGYENYIKAVQSVAEGVLNELESQKNYDQLMENNLDILEALNKALKDEKESTEDETVKICESRFSAVAISPLIDGEYSRIGKKIEQDQNKVRHMLNSMRDEIDGAPEKIRNSLVSSCRGLQRSFASFGVDINFNDFPEIKKDSNVNLVLSNLKKSFESVAEHFKNQLAESFSAAAQIGDDFRKSFTNDVEPCLEEITESLNSFDQELENLFKQVRNNQVCNIRNDE